MPEVTGEDLTPAFAAVVLIVAVTPRVTDLLASPVVG